MIGAKMVKPKRSMRWMVMGMCLALGGGPFLFADPPADPGKPLRYLMVLKAQGAGAEEPDVRQAGGRELSRWRTRRLIEVPRPAIEALSRHKAVSYLALVDDGTETDAPRYVLGQAEGSSLRVETNVEPELGWDSGLYQYDDSGNIKAIGGNTFQYDKAQRLKKAVVGGETIEYTYDSFGNQNERKIGTTIIKTAANARSNRLDDAEYDRAGNQIAAVGSVEEYVYDAANMMVQRRALNPRRYIYTADDERIGTANGGDVEWEWTIRDFSGRVMATYGSECGPSELCSWEWKEVHHYRDGALASGVTIDERVRGIGNARYFHLDHLGTTRLITNQARQKIAAHDYHPFGREQTKVNKEFTGWLHRTLEPMKFTGHERDYTSSVDANAHDYLDYMHARFYNPSQGRFLSVDPVPGEPSRPQSWNRYAYVLNNPLAYVDPTGMDEVGFRCNDHAECTWDLVIPPLEYTTGDLLEDWARETATDVLMKTGFPQTVAGFINDDVGQIAAGYGTQLSWAVPGGVASGTTKTLTGGGRVLTQLPDLAPELVYGARVEARALAEPGLYHNFPQMIDDVVTSAGQIEVVSGNYVQYTMRGAINGQTGIWEIGGRPLLNNIASPAESVGDSRLKQ